VYEHHRIKNTEFPLFQAGSSFTHDTVLTVAVAYVILTRKDYAGALREFGRRYPHSGYGSRFLAWLRSNDSRPYNSWGNGSAMRVSPVGFAFDTVDDVLREAQRSAEVTHNHPEGIKGAQATALAIFLARKTADKAVIRNEITQRFGYKLNSTVDKIRPWYRFDESCQCTVPEAIIAFLDSHDYEDAVRKAISLGGDSDTLACITGGIAQAFYKHIPDDVVRETRERLPPDLLGVVDDFSRAYPL
jgi:ADP-ribosylglycohydrolase